MEIISPQKLTNETVQTEIINYKLYYDEHHARTSTTSNSTWFLLSIFTGFTTPHYANNVNNNNYTITISKFKLLYMCFFLHSHDLLIILFNQYGKFVVFNFIINHLDKYERIRQKKILKTSRRKYNELILVRSIRQHAYVDVLLSRAINEYLI